MSYTCAMVIYDPCPKCDAPLNPYHQKNGCEMEEDTEFCKICNIPLTEDDINMDEGKCEQCIEDAECECEVCALNHKEGECPEEPK